MSIVLHAVILTNTVNDEVFNTTLGAINSLKASFQQRGGLSICVVESNQQSDYQYPNDVSVFVPDEKFNFNRFLNIGMGNVQAEYYALCNNDIEFDKLWFDNIKKELDELSDVESFSPVCPLSERQKLLDHQRPYKLGYRPTFEISGWCLVLKQSLVKKIFPLDERFNFYFADNDYAMTLRHLNIKHALVFSSQVKHLEHKKISKIVSLNPRHQSDKKRGRTWKLNRYQWIYNNPMMLDGYRVYQQKWGSIVFTRWMQLFHDVTFLKCGLKWPTKLLIHKKGA